MKKPNKCKQSDRKKKADRKKKKKKSESSSSHHLLASKRKFSFKNIDLKAYFKKCADILQNDSAFAKSDASTCQNDQINYQSELSCNNDASSIENARDPNLTESENLAVDGITNQEKFTADMKIEMEQSDSTISKDIETSTHDDSMSMTVCDQVTPSILRALMNPSRLYPEMYAALNSNFSTSVDIVSNTENQSDGSNHENIEPSMFQPYEDPIPITASTRILDDESLTECFLIAMEKSELKPMKLKWYDVVTRYKNLEDAPIDIIILFDKYR
ncbi:uncharacterized protein TRIADDRAFT_59826 [Trichoplax adhaerens]|uniref:Uncharacterized protein n=1 Tax=Trichoplax adhaerens TaxID=10228 RepID=B3S6J4_TRIAD|nr:predicted protein [Trichoplax adhaerens]EDV21772.1 predicted protein [Trichoplax adhaerens]|eukprot:XP_002115920.1 predicted protein [Trichoplax adhaerens]